MKKQKILAIALASVILIFSLSSCKADRFDIDAAKYNYPSLVSGDGWESTMDVDFASITSMEELNKNYWYSVKHGLRKYEYWCPDMIDFSSSDGLVIHSVQSENHVCTDELCPLNGVFTGGIDSRDPTTGEGFYQAFGYFEVEVKVPTGDGMWSAFWLQSTNTGRIGKKGMDGSEIDVYESSFKNSSTPNSLGNAIHYDAYDWPFYQSHGAVSTTENNPYDGEFHTYGLLWTPKEYVFYMDGKPYYATKFGGVAKIAEYLRLTVEIRTGVQGPYSQDIGEFSNDFGAANDFVIKSVKVYQKDEYKSEIKTLDDMGWSFLDWAYRLFKK
ncbi:MAG: family 16 glycosylhydrolase [Clostridiales bacterium]|jgi:hypothetical protein|nr:family 16 glycosylhydrolase [Clostridiales bacterium]